MKKSVKIGLLVLLAVSQILLLSYVTSFEKSVYVFFFPSSESSSDSASTDMTRQLSYLIDKRIVSTANLPSTSLSIAGAGGGGGGSDVKADTVIADSAGDVKPDGSGDVKPDGAGDVKADQGKSPGKPLSPSELPSCPETPPNLKGYIPMTKDVLKPMAELEKDWGSTLTPGGHYHPPHCRPRERTAIIIPCRNRWEHLRILLNTLIPFLIRQEIHFTLFVLEPDQDSHFNKGILLNAGYLESLKLGNYSCFVFQDVDLLPLNDLNLYRCGPQPRHLAVAIDKFGFKMPYNWYFGGTLALNREQYEKVNGHSNVYFGWGGEDDDITHRVTAKGYKVLRVPIKNGQYHMIKHVRDKGNEVVAQKMPLVAKRQVVRRMNLEGVHQVVYTKDWTQTTPLFTWIHITVNETDVIQNYPDFVRERFKNGLIIKH